MVLDSALQGHAAGAKELLAAVTKDPSLLEDPSLAFLKEFCENYPPAAPEAETDDDAGGEFMKREKTPFPAVPTNAAEAPDDADWSIASTQEERGPSGSAGGGPRPLHRSAPSGGRHRVPVGDDAREARRSPVEARAAGGGHQRL